MGRHLLGHRSPLKLKKIDFFFCFTVAITYNPYIQKKKYEAKPCGGNSFLQNKRFYFADAKWKTLALH